MFLSFLVIFLKCYSIQLFDWELGRRKGSFLDVISMLKLKIHEKNLQKITPLLTKFALSFLFLSFPSSLLFEIKLLLFLSNVFSDPGGGVGVRALEVGRTKGRAEVVLWEGEVIFGSKTKKNIFHHHFWSWSKTPPPIRRQPSKQPLIITIIWNSFIQIITSIIILNCIVIIIGRVHAVIISHLVLTVVAESFGVEVDAFADGGGRW